MNAKIRPEDCNGTSFSKKTKLHGQALLTMHEECNLPLLNTMFRKRKGKQWTFLYPNGEKAQFDDIMVKKKWQSTFSTIGSYHRIVTAEMKFKLRAPKKSKIQTKFNWNSLVEDDEIKAKYNVEMRNRFDALNAKDLLQSAK